MNVAALDRACRGYAIKVALDAASQHPGVNPLDLSDDQIAEALKWCARRPERAWFPIIRAALATYLTEKAEQKGTQT